MRMKPPSHSPEPSIRYLVARHGAKKGWRVNLAILKQERPDCL
jgi:hypothetical protein